MKSRFVLLLLIIGEIAYAQETIPGTIESVVNKGDARACIYYLASDELRGRGTGTPEVDEAAEYLAMEYEKAGIRMLSGRSSFFQEVEMMRPHAPTEAKLIIGNESFTYKEDFLVSYGGKLDFDGEFVFVGYGNEDDFEKVNVADKVVVSFTGISNKSTAQSYTSDQLVAKQIRARDRGAAALIEILTFESVEWETLAEFLVYRSTDVSFRNVNGYIPHFWMKKPESEAVSRLIDQGKSNGKFIFQAPDPDEFVDNNVIGWIEGTDPELKNEYVVLSAHYDHIGVFETKGNDSIHNGARDNAVGVAAILLAVKAMVKQPPKRSVLIMAFCAEEIDMLGSDWYTRHPLVPLNQTVFNLNCDGAGYNDKSLMTVIDLNRTSANDLLRSGARQYGLELSGDPAPSEDLYSGSDNFIFALKGI